MITVTNIEIFSDHLDVWPLVENTQAFLNSFLTVNKKGVVFVSRHFSCLMIVSKEFCNLLFGFCFLWFLSWCVDQNVA